MPYTTTNHEWFWYNKVREVVTWEDPATGKEVLASPAQPVTSGPSEPAVTAAGAAAGDRSEGAASTDEAVQVEVDTAAAGASASYEPAPAASVGGARGAAKRGRSAAQTGNLKATSLRSRASRGHLKWKPRNRCLGDENRPRRALAKETSSRGGSGSSQARKGLLGPGSQRKCRLCVVYGESEEDKARLQMKWSDDLGELDWAEKENVAVASP